MAYKVFIDTNVFLDAFLQRTSDWLDADAVLQLADNDFVKAYTSSSCLINMIYALKAQKKLTPDNIINVTELTLGYTSVLNPSKAVFLQSLRSGFADLEDGIQYYTARSEEGIDYFITSNTKDFKKASSQLPVLSPKQFMKLYLKG
jgi:predicted nucleic acid-binding protein